MRNIDCKRIIHAMYCGPASQHRVFSHAGLPLSACRKYIKFTDQIVGLQSIICGGGILLVYYTPSIVPMLLNSTNRRTDCLFKKN